MPKERRNLTSLEMRNLIFDALATDDKADTPRGITFKEKDYKGCISNLYDIVEFLAVKHNLIDKVAEIPITVWGAEKGTLTYRGNTSFDENEINLFFEETHLLIGQNVISPGAIGHGYSDAWPYFHVTRYGLECLAKRDIVPYDPENYMKRLRAIASFDDWEEFYMEQCLKCYNIGAMESAIIMLGLEGEYLANRLIDALQAFLDKNEPAEYKKYITALKGKNKISQRFIEYEKYQEKCASLRDSTNNIKYPELKKLAPSLDGAAKATYATFLRLTRNELAHPANVRMERIQALTMLISFVKYCETQHKYFEFYMSNP